MQTRYPQSNLLACLVPWTKDFELDVPAFEEHLQSALNSNSKHIYLLGTASEGYALSDDLFKQVINVYAANTVIDGVDPQVGLISTSMGQVIHRIEYCYKLGIRMFQLTLPCWGVPDEPELLLFFKTVCGKFPDCRFLHYNLPRAKKIVTGIEYRKIADEVPNLVATKNSSWDFARTADLMNHVPDIQHFFLEGNFAMGCAMGECSLICSYDILCPETTRQFYEAGLRKDLNELFRITKLFYDLENALFAHCDRDMIDGSFDKTFAWLNNPDFSNRILPPYIGLSEEESRICREEYERCWQHVK